jgi:hypothetical protein
MPLDSSSTRQRLLSRLKAKEEESGGEIAEIRQALDDLENIARLITGKPLEKIRLTPEVQKVSGKTRTLKNRNVTALVRQYIEDRRAHKNPSLEEFKRDSLVHVPTVLDWLKEQGVVGDDRNLSSSVHVILKKETARNPELHYTKGLGYYKGEAPADTLVASA